MHQHFQSARRGHLPFGPGFAGRGPGGHGGFGPWGFGPGEMRGRGWGGPRAKRGDVRQALLGLLAEGPSNGYGLIRSIGERTDGAWQPSPGSVYPTLAQLVDEGLVTQADGPRGAYSLTDAGRAFVEANREQVDAALSGPQGAGGEGEEDLFTAFKKLAGAAMQFRGGVSTEQRTRATEKVDELRRELYRILGE